MQDEVPNQSCQSDVMDPARAHALQITLGHSPTIEAGSPLPPFFHQIYFWDARKLDALGRDGHPRVGGLIPDMGLPRRMWAGGTLFFNRPLKAGVLAEKHSQCLSHQRKKGRSGPLGLVTLRHEIHQSGDLCVIEEQDLVYRAEATPDAPKPVPPVADKDEEASEELSFSSTQLFRYSGLTFNGHRIHYDLPYAQDVEGYRGLVVHGPLLAQYLMLMAERQLGALVRFTFRATSPLMHFEKAELCRRGDMLWVRGPDGRQCMSAQATPLSK